MKMAKRTLHSALTPLLTLIHLFGVNWRSEKRKGLKVMKMLMAAIFLFVYVSSTVLWLIYKLAFFPRHSSDDYSKEENIDFSRRFLPSIVNGLAFVSYLVQWKQWDDLIRMTKACSITTYQYHRIKKAHQLLLYAPLATSALCTIASFFLSFKMETELNIGMVIVIWICETLSNIPFYFLALNSLYVYFIAYYIKIVWSDLIEETQRSKSELRRNKMAARLFSTYYRLEELIGRLDSACAFVMFVLRATVAFTLSIIMFVYDEGFKDFGFLSIVFLTPVYGTHFLNAVIIASYLLVASTVNKVVCSLGRVLAQSAVLRSTRLPLDLSYSNQLKVQMDHVIQLTHFVLDSRSLTLQGNPIRGEALFSLAAEMTDNVNCVVGHVL